MGPRCAAPRRVFSDVDLERLADDSRYEPTRPRMAYRLTVYVFLLVVFLYDYIATLSGSVHFMNDYQPGVRAARYFIYITMWGYVLTIIYFMLAWWLPYRLWERRRGRVCQAAEPAADVGNGSSRGAKAMVHQTSRSQSDLPAVASHPDMRLRKTLAIVLTLSYCWAPVITLIFWIAIFPTIIMTGTHHWAVSTTMHGVSHALLWIDVFSSGSDLPVVTGTWIPLVVMSLLYSIVNLGVSLGEKPVYAVITWRTGASVIWILIAVGILTLAFWSLLWFGRWAERRRERRVAERRATHAPLPVQP